MNVLFIHQNFPGQFLHLSADLAAQKHNRVVALSTSNNPVPKGVIATRYSLLRSPAPETHPMLREEETKVLHAEACAAAALKLKREGFIPDVIVAHPGWGEALFIKDVFPNSKLIMYCEYYYAAEGQDVGFDAEDPPLTFAHRCRIRLKNTTNLLSLEIADAAISPTQWQKSTYPTWAQQKITVIHDGIDLNNLRFNPKAQITLTANVDSSAHSFRPGDEVLTYVARNLEPIRGFRIFMRSLPSILRQRPNAHIIVVGGDEISYGQPPPGGGGWKEHMLAEVGSELDLRRVHFVGKVPYSTYLQLLSVSAVHAYWTSPFVLSWSFLEAALSGVHVVASATPPILEFSADLQVETQPFFETEAFAGSIVAALQEPRRRRPAPRIKRLQLSECLKLQRKLISS
ncbi:MAG: glycosyltransferase [Pseudomonadota bacterium]